MFFRSKSRFSTKNIVKLDLKNIIGNDKCPNDPSNMLKYYIPIPKAIFEIKPDIEVTSFNPSKKVSVAKLRKVECLVMIVFLEEIFSEGFCFFQEIQICLF
jgi:hypothetical protein